MEKNAEEYFYNHWQQSVGKKFGDYGDYDSDKYAIAFANDFASQKVAILTNENERLERENKELKNINHAQSQAGQ